MIIAPDWSKLKGITRGIDDPDALTRRQARERLMATIIETLPDVTAVRCYAIDPQTVKVVFATDQEPLLTKPLVERTDITACLTSSDSYTWDRSQRQWLYPLDTQAGEAFGVFEVIVDDLDEDWLTWLSLIGEQLAHHLSPTEHPSPLPHTADPAQQDDPERLLTAAQMLMVARDDADIATAAVYATRPPVAGLMITRFDHFIPVQDDSSESLQNNYRNTLAFATRQQTDIISEGASTSQLPEASHLTDLRRGLAIVVDNVAVEAGYLSTWTRERLIAGQFRQVVAFPMIAVEQVIGTLDLLYTESKRPTQSELNYYTLLARQIASKLISQQMVDRALAAQAFASQLVKTNKALAVAENYTQMAEAILKDAPDSIESVAIALFNRPFTLMGTPASLRTQALVTRHGGVQEANIVDTFSATEDARITYFLHEFLEGKMMLMWNIMRPRRSVMAQILVNRLQEEDVSVITAFGLNMQNSLRGIVVFGGDEELRDMGPQYDGLRAIVDQVAAVIENQILLQQANEALDLIQSQYETTSAVFRARNLAQTMQALYTFTDGRFSNVQLVLTNPDGETAVVAEVINGKGKQVNRPVALQDYPGYRALGVMEALEVRDVAEDVFVTAEERDRLLSEQVQSFVILPIVSNFVPVGLIMFSNDAPVRLQADRLRALRSLTDQVSIVLENRKLLQNTEASLRESQTLYAASRAMLRTQTPEDVLEALQIHLASDAKAICQVTLERGADGALTGVVLRYEKVADRITELNEQMTVSPMQLSEITSFVERLQDRVLFSPKGTSISSNPISLLAARYNMHSYAGMVITQREWVTGFIYLIFDTPQSFDESTRRLYETVADQVSIAAENQALLRASQESTDQLREQVEALQTISKLATTINQIKDERSLLATSAESLVKVLDVDHCGIVLFNDDMDSGVVISEYPETGLVNRIISTQDNPLLNPTHESQVFIIEDVATDPRISESLRASLLGFNIHGLMLISLVGTNGDLIGSVGLDVYNQPRQFNDNEQRTAQTIAAQMAVGLQNVRLLLDAQQRAEQLQYISEFSQASQATLDLDTLVEQALVDVPQLLEIDHMSVALFDDLRGQLLLVGGWHQQGSERIRLMAGEQIDLEQTIVGHVFTTGNYLLLPDIRAHDGLDYAYGDNLRGLLVMPLRNRGSVLGVVTIGSFEVGRFTDTDIAVFQQVANQMSVAMDNARAYTQSQRIARNKTLANNIALKLQQQNSLEQMINMTMEDVGRALQAKRGRIRLQTNFALSESDNQ